MRPHRHWFLLTMFLAAGIAIAQEDVAKSSTKKDRPEDWIVLFDGKSAVDWKSGWKKNTWKVENGDLVSPGGDARLESSREYGDFELTFEFKNDGREEAVLGFGKYSERDSHPVRIYLRGNRPGWQKIHLDIVGTDAAGKIESIETGKDPIFPEAVIRERKTTRVPLVFKGPALRLRNIKLKPLEVRDEK
jgi:hypothetical protein